MWREPADDEMVARYLGTVATLVDRANLDPDVIDRLLHAFENGSINPHGTGNSIQVTPDERKVIKALAIRAIAARGGRFDHDGMTWINDEARGLRRTLPWD
jgi:hypothetical protein